MRKRDHNLVTNAASLLICGLLAGVVVAAAAFPAIAMSGLAAKASAETFDKLPSELTVKQAPQITNVFAGDGRTLLALFFDENRRDVALKSVSPLMQKAMIAAEDHDFYKHNGVDVPGIARAFVANKGAGETTQGASTLTMQYVRLSIAYSAEKPAEVVAATEDTNVRKLKEMRYALAIEKKLSKDEILERYLNIAPFGNGAYGIFAASQVYFKKLPKDLTIDEAAMLAGMVKAPSSFDPTTKGGYPLAVERRDYVINQMVEIGAITPEQATKAKAVKLTVRGERTPNGCVATKQNQWGFFCDYFYRWWMSQDTFGATTYDRERRLKSGGYNIVTTLDLKVQNAAKKNVEQYRKTGNSQALMVAAIEPGSGRVRALAVNRNFKLDDPKNPKNKISTNPAKKKRNIRGTYPNTTNPLLSGGGDITGYQFGSTFKIFTLVAALEKGLPLATTINATSPIKTDYIVEYGSPAACPGTNKYCPSNANPSWMNGVRNMWTGFGRSVNTYMVKLQEIVGADKVVDSAKRLGIQFRAANDARIANDREYAKQWGAFTLGVSATTPLDMANAYATLAADGMYCEPTPIEQITTRDNQKLDIGKPHCERATSVDVARAALDAARCPVGDRARTGSCEGATARVTRGVVGHPVFGKTGTTDRDRTASLIAGTTSLVVAGYLVNPDYQAHKDRMDHDQVNPAVYRTLGDYMDGKPKVQFKRPENRKIVYGDQRRIPDVECLSLTRARDRIENAGFDAVLSNSEVESKCPAGTAAGTSPSGRTVKNGVVVIEISNGKGAEPPEGPGGTPPIVVPPPR